MADTTSHTKIAEKTVADLTVFFDGSCPLCRSEIGVYRNCTGAHRIAFVDVAQAGPGDVAVGLGRIAALERFYVRTADGSLHSGAAAFAQLWLRLPGWSWAGSIILLPGVETVPESAYRGFLLIRPAIQWCWRRAASARAIIRI